MYIIQNMLKYLNINHYVKDSDSTMSYFDKTIEKPLLDELYDLKYLMIIAEPGYGKTRLLKEIALKAKEHNKKAFFIDSKNINNIVNSIEKCKEISNNINEEDLQKEFLFSNTLDTTLDENSIVCLDALDELPFSKLYDFFEKIEEFIELYPAVQLFISCRTHHLKKVDYDLVRLPFEYITLQAFDEEQITKYLIYKTNESKAKLIEEKLMQSQLFTFLSTPRYLYYFTELVKDKNIDEIVKLSRAEIFDNFIYRKLKKEKDTKTPFSQYDIIKRVLEKIAFVMKINQVSQITKDELFTIFEDIDSNFSQVVFKDDLLNILYDKSIIKDNIDSIEFENQEFLDFLASKEISRFDKVEQVFFDIAVEPHLQEIFTSWFYVLPFLLEQQPSMIQTLLDFLKKNSNKALRDDYFLALMVVETKFLEDEIRTQIFTLVVNYYNQHEKWFHIDNLAYFYDEKIHYQNLLDSVDKTQYKSEDLYMRRNNIVEIVRLLVKNKKFSKNQVEYWKAQFKEWLNLDIMSNKILHRNIINSLTVVVKDDFEYIKSLYFIFETGIDVQYYFAQVCFKLMPEDKFSIDIYFDADKVYYKNKVTSSHIMDDSIEHIFGLKSLEGLSYSIKKLIEVNLVDEQRLRILFNNLYGDYENQFEDFISNISQVANIGLLRDVKEFIQILFNNDYLRGDEKVEYLKKIFLEKIIKKDKNYIFELIALEYKKYEAGENFFGNMEDLVSHYLITYINNENFDKIYELLKKFENTNRALKSLMYEMYINENIDIQIKDKIEDRYANSIDEIEKNIQERNSKSRIDKTNKLLDLCKQWQYKIEPAENQYITDLFRFFRTQKETLKQCSHYEENKLRTIDVAKEIIRSNNPLDAKVEVRGNTTNVRGTPNFSDSIKLLDSENIELDEKILIDNIFRYLAFNINSDYKITLKLAHNPSYKAMQDILNVYDGTTRDDDLYISHPRNFIQLYKHINLKEAEPLLLRMLFNQDIREYIRVEIVDVLPKTVLTQEIIEKYIQEFGEEDELYEKMLYTLIQTHRDDSSLDKAFKIIIEKVKNIDIPDDKFSFQGSSLDMSFQKLVFAVINTDYSISKDKELLLLSSQLYRNSKSSTTNFIQDMVFKHIKYLKHKNSFEPIFEIEKFLQETKDKTNLHWFEYKLVELKEIYLDELAKPANISASVKKYNELKKKDYLAISSPLHLLEIIQDIIFKDLTNWIENEGAYKHIEELSKKVDNTNAEDFIQKSFIAQIELALYKKGFRSTDFRIKREEQNLADKRADITISYGFIGSILIELKLEGNPEAIPTQAVSSRYVQKLNKYINGTKSDYGIFLIFNIRSEKEKFENQMKNLAKLYENEKKITVLGINCKI